MTHTITPSKIHLLQEYELTDVVIHRSGQPPPSASAYISIILTHTHTHTVIYSASVLLQSRQLSTVTMQSRDHSSPDIHRSPYWVCPFLIIPINRARQYSPPVTGFFPSSCLQGSFQIHALALCLHRPFNWVCSEYPPHLSPSPTGLVSGLQLSCVRPTHCSGFGTPDAIQATICCVSFHKPVAPLICRFVFCEMGPGPCLLVLI